MSTVETARWAGVSGLAKNTSGVVDSANDYLSMRSASGTGVAFAMVRQGARLYIEGPTGQWCLAVQSSSVNGANRGFPTLVDAVEMLRKEGASVRYIGPEVIRGVATSHFRSHAAQTFDVWVDAHDQLRRVSGRIPAIAGVPSEVPTSFAEDFFDFGVPVHFNPPKADTPRCEHDSTVP